MPRPAVLPTLDWEAIFSSGKPYAEWIAAGEIRANCDYMENDLSFFALESQIENSVASLQRLVHVVAFAEDWCGDVVRHVPVLRAFENSSGKIKVAYFTREEQPEVFIRFLTNGGEAVPKFIFLSEDFVECGNWGPMPDAARQLISRGKACNDVAAARMQVKAAYDSDPQRSQVQNELAALMQIASCTDV